MTKCAPVWRLFLFLFLALSLIGCSQFRRSEFADEKDPHYLEGKRRQSGMDWNGAIQSFERALQSNPNNAAAHLELGLILGEKKNDYAGAVYHYQKHLTLYTNSPQRDAVIARIGFCKRELADVHAFAVVGRDIQPQLERLIRTNEVYKKRIEYLEAELARGPRYITNHVTNFVTLPDFSEGSSRSLTRTTTIVEPPPTRVEPKREREPEVSPAPDAEKPRTVASSAARTTAQNRPSNLTPRSERRTVTPSPRTAQAATSTRPRTVHTVRPGDTMAVLARRYGVTTAQLRAANPGLAGGTRAGQQITIPKK